MNKKHSLLRSISAAPHIFWSVLFIVLPLIIVVFYAFTDTDGNFSFENILSLSDYAPIFLLSLELSKKNSPNVVLSRISRVEGVRSVEEL